MSQVFSSIFELPHHPWLDGEGSDEDVVVYSQVLLSRNLERFPFPWRMSSRDLPEMFSLLDQGFSYGDYEPIHPAQLASLRRQLLVEGQVLHGDEIGPQHKLYHRRDGSHWVNVNSDDHLHFEAVARGLSLYPLYDQLNRLERSLEGSLGFAVNMEFGYLNTHIDRAGTGLHLGVMVQAPALAASERLGELIQEFWNQGIELNSLKRGDVPSLSEVFLLSNLQTLGASEETLMEKLLLHVRELVDYERTARAEGRKTMGIAWEDAVWRAWGIMTNARTLSAEEAIHHIGTLRQGVGEGLFPKSMVQGLTQLMWLIQGAHLSWLQGDRELILEEQDRGPARAAMCRKVLHEYS